ncbi:MAG: DUF2442 domain-containing protein [Rhodocyclales bacterium]|nr:DUF2442 domain-containing protein [Rhodocyclales bacterium]
MSIEAKSKTDRPAGVVPAAPWRVRAFSVQPGFRLAITFVDGTRGVADLSRLVAGRNPGVYGALADPAVFEQARLELGVITWPNGADLDPDWLHQEISRQAEWLVPD